MTGRARVAFAWGAVIAALAVPVIASAFSPYLAWRQPVYIVSGFAGIVGMALMVIQPLLAAQYLPGLQTLAARRVHRWVGLSIVAAVIVHVVGLWITSPPDVVDALLLVSPTPFSVWGVVAMWTLFLSALLVVLRRRLRLRWRVWRLFHTALAAVIVAGTVVHVLLIEGTMETVSKILLACVLIAVTAKAFVDLKVWSGRALQARQD